uniref:BSD domain-containing protein n=1 Tax=Macrostomum lignano TaxID=282301 RepID=A0A1I8I595_9PLAT
SELFQTPTLAMLADASAPSPRQASLGSAAKSWGTTLYCLGRRATSAVASTAAAAAAAAMAVTDSGQQQQQASLASSAAAEPPWSGLEPGPRNQILSLAEDPRNFLRPPPASCGFEFCLEPVLPSAMAALEADPALRQMRFRLVPRRLAEEQFWRNYFYRVSVIRRSAQLSVSTPALATVARDARAHSPAEASECSSACSSDSFERVPSREALEAEVGDDVVEIVYNDWERELQLELAGLEPITSGSQPKD